MYDAHSYPCELFLFWTNYRLRELIKYRKYWGTITPNFRVLFILQGIHGISEEVYLSVPCVLGENGVTHLVKQQLTNTELEKLHKSASIMKENIDKLNMWGITHRGSSIVKEEVI